MKVKGSDKYREKHVKGNDNIGGSLKESVDGRYTQ